jgi:hypothetical protein
MNPEFTPEYWLCVKPGSSIHLNSPYIIETFGIDGITTTVSSVGTVAHNLATWVILYLKDPSGAHMVLIKIVDDELDIRVYFSRATIGDRKDLYDSGSLGDYFIEPDDSTVQWDLNDLMYAQQLTRITDNTSFTYIQKMPELDCEYVELPGESGLNYPLLATIVEYVLDDESDTQYELLILEIGDSCSEDGGLIEEYYGTSISTIDIELVKK